MNKRIFVVAASTVLWLICGITACQSQEAEVKGTEGGGVVASGTEQPDASQGTEKASEQEVDWFVYKPAVKSPFYNGIYTEKAMKSYENMIDAVTNYKDEFKMSGDTPWWKIEEVINYLFPPYGHVISEVKETGGVCHIKYLYDKAKTKQILDDFGQRVEWWINSCTREDEPDMLKAMEVYQKMAKEVTYNYDVLDPEKEGDQDVTPYNAIMYQNGICQSFGSSYAYLLMQLGIDACPTGGLSEAGLAHEWTLLKLDGKWFYADPTYENGTDSSRLYFFGMTAQKRNREDGYIIKLMNVGECNAMWGTEIDVSDNRFDALEEIYSVEKMYADDKYVYVDGLDFNGQLITVKIKD